MDARGLALASGGFAGVLRAANRRLVCCDPELFRCCDDDEEGGGSFANLERLSLAR